MMAQNDRNKIAQKVCKNVFFGFGLEKFENSQKFDFEIFGFNYVLKHFESIPKKICFGQKFSFLCHFLLKLKVLAIFEFF